MEEELSTLDSENNDTESPIKKHSMSLGKFNLSKILTDEDQCYGELILLGYFFLFYNF